MVSLAVKYLLILKISTQKLTFCLVFKLFLVKTMNFIRHEIDQNGKKNSGKCWMCSIEKHI